MCKVLPLKKSTQNLSFFKKLIERELLLWIDGEICINTLIIISNKTKVFKSFYAPGLTNRDLNMIKKVSTATLKFKTSTPKSLISTFRQQGILVLHINNSIIHLNNCEIDCYKIKSTEDIITELKKLKFNFSPTFEIKCYPIKMKRKPINNKKNENLDTTDKLQKILNPNFSNSCIINMEMYHKLNDIKINIKKFEDEFGEITIKKQKKNTNKKPKNQ